MAKANQINLSFSFEKETKNTCRFAEDVEGDEPTVVGAIYVHKANLKAMGNPKKLSVTITKTA